MFGSILLLFFLTWLDKSPVWSGSYRPIFKRFFWLVVIDVLILGYVGGAEINARNIALGQIASAYYFLHFLVILPLIARYETPLPLPNSIRESVLHGEAAEAAPAGQGAGRGSVATAAAE
jgi:ubiquinol-cytochrome c reductase cytochrome b subunit